MTAIAVMGTETYNIIRYKKKEKWEKPEEQTIILLRFLPLSV